MEKPETLKLVDLRFEDTFSTVTIDFMPAPTFVVSNTWC